MDKPHNPKNIERACFYFLRSLGEDITDPRVFPILSDLALTLNMRLAVIQQGGTQILFIKEEKG
jgi:hypothetical protein